MSRHILSTVKKRLSLGYTTRLLLIILVVVIFAFLGIESSVRAIISKELLQEKQVMLFGLAEQLNIALDGTYDDILRQNDALSLPRGDKIEVLHNQLKAVTDFVASGVPGVGVGYYSRDLDAIITYGPEDQFGHTIGQSIFEGHLGYQVMAEGKSLVQQGALVRGKILNCMLPVIRDGQVIGYIWANETLEDVSSQLSIVFEEILIFTLIIFFLLYVAVLLPTWYFNRRIDQLISDIGVVMSNPRERLPRIVGPLASVVDGVNSLLDKVFFFKSKNEYIFDSVMSGILAVSVEGEILLANPSFLEMVDMSGRNLLGEKCNAVLSDDLCSLIFKALEGTNRKKTKDIIYQGRIIEVFNNEVYNDKNIQIGEVFIFRDRTLLKLYERKLNDQERLAAIGEMGLNIAHEIKNPLTAVKGFSQLMHRRNLSQEKMNDYLELMDDELNRIDKLLNDLLVNGGKSKLQPEYIDFSNMLSEFIVIYSNSYPGIKFSLKTDIVSSPILKVDKNKIAQLVDNIIKNSVEAIEAKPEPKKKNIDFNLLISSDKVILKIRDSGEGIAEENYARIMTPFYTTKKEGTGLGMSLCLGIVEKHQGVIRINSEVNVFTEVTIEFNIQKLENLNDS